MMKTNETKKKPRMKLSKRQEGIKEALAKAMDFDLDRILEDARQRQEKSGRIVLSPPIRSSI